MAHPHEREAGDWVATEIERLRNLPYEDLVPLQGQPEHRPRETADSTPLVLETQVFWDDSQRRNLRVLVDVWDPSKRIAGSIVRDDFIRAPDGSFPASSLGGHSRTLAQASAMRPGGGSQGRAGRDSIAKWLSGLGLPDFGVRSELAQRGQRSEPSAADDQPLGLLRFRSYWTRVAPHAQVNTATPRGTVAWLT